MGSPAPRRATAWPSTTRETPFKSKRRLRTSSQLTWDTAGSLESILSDGVNDYIYGPTGEPVEQINITPSPPPNNPIFMTYTSADGTWLTTNSAGDQLAYWSYDAYGAGTIGTPDSPFGFGGQYTDVTGGTSLINMRARWYQPQSGEFTTQDPGLARQTSPTPTQMTIQLTRRIHPGCGLMGTAFPNLFQASTRNPMEIDICQRTQWRALKTMVMEMLPS